MRYSDSGGLSAHERAERERVRFEAIELLDQGVPPSRVAKRLRVTRKSVYEWRQRWQAGGSDALRSKGPGGSRCQLDDEQLQQLREELQRGPATHGWDDDQRWTAARVADLVRDLFRVSYTDRGMAYLLKRIGYTPQVPVHRAVERDEDAIETWVREVWPQVKARRRPRGPGSASRTNQARD